MILIRSFCPLWDFAPEVSASSASPPPPPVLALPRAVPATNLRMAPCQVLGLISGVPGGEGIFQWVSQLLGSEGL